MHLKKCLLLLVACFIAGDAFMQKEKPRAVNYLAKWVIQKGGSLKVDGSTNVNQFSCAITNYSTPDTLMVYRNANPKDIVLPFQGDINLDIVKFDCHNPMMTNDLRKTLKAKEYPVMVIKFLSLSKMPELKTTQESITGLVDIELAGTTKRYDVSYTFSVDEQKQVHLIGNRAVTFSDFHLKPPRRLGGMIQAKDKLDVEFRLTLKQLP
jgi:hypothetical protein